LCRLVSWALAGQSSSSPFDINSLPLFPVKLLAGLTTALDPDSGVERYLVFQHRQKRKGRRPNVVGDYQIAVHVWALMDKKWPVEAAVQDAMTTFRLSRKAVYATIKRAKKNLHTNQRKSL
jgi:hypothetical protein